MVGAKQNNLKAMRGAEANRGAKGEQHETKSTNANELAILCRR